MAEREKGTIPGHGKTKEEMVDEMEVTSAHNDVISTAEPKIEVWKKKGPE